MDKSGDDAESNLVTLIESPSGEPLQKILSQCNFCQNDLKKQTKCHFDRHTSCGYYRTAKFVYPTCCPHKTKTSSPEKVLPSLADKVKPTATLSKSSVITEIEKTATEVNKAQDKVTNERKQTVGTSAPVDTSTLHTEGIIDKQSTTSSVSLSKPQAPLDADLSLSEAAKASDTSFILITKSEASKSDSVVDIKPTPTQTHSHTSTQENLTKPEKLEVTTPLKTTISSEALSVDGTKSDKDVKATDQHVKSSQTTISMATTIVDNEGKTQPASRDNDKSVCQSSGCTAGPEEPQVRPTPVSTDNMEATQASSPSSTSTNIQDSAEKSQQPGDKKVISVV